MAQTKKKKTALEKVVWTEEKAKQMRDNLVELNFKKADAQPSSISAYAEFEHGVKHFGYLLMEVTCADRCPGSARR